MKQLLTIQTKMKIKNQLIHSIQTSIHSTKKQIIHSITIRDPNSIQIQIVYFEKKMLQPFQPSSEPSFDSVLFEHVHHQHFNPICRSQSNNRSVLKSGHSVWAIKNMKK
jgi:hypothetical protein